MTRIHLPPAEAKQVQAQRAVSAQVFQFHTMAAISVMGKLTDTHCNEDELAARAKKAVEAADALLLQYGLIFQRQTLQEGE